MLKVKELKKILEDFDDEDDVAIEKTKSYMIVSLMMMNGAGKKDTHV